MSIEFIALTIAALITGISKFSVGGMGMLIAPILIYAFPATTVLGVLLPIYLITDLMVVSIYRKEISWRVIRKIVPYQFIGMLLASIIIYNISITFLPKLIALLIIFMLALGLWLDYHEATFMRNDIAIKGTGIFAGLVALTANAGGPFVSLIMLEQKLTKDAYISTRAWCFFFIDLFKIPILISLGYLNQETISLSIQAIPSLILGSIIGFTILNKIEMNNLKWLIRGISLLAALKLIIG